MNKGQDSQFRASNTFRTNKGGLQSNSNDTRNVFGTVGNKMAAFNSTKSIIQNSAVNQYSGNES